MELLFRAWDTVTKKFSYFNTVDLVNHGGNLDGLFGIGQRPDFSNWQQYSGMEIYNSKKKNTKKVYEGDILKVTTEDQQKILVVCRFGTAKRVMDTGWEVNISGFYFERSDGLKSFPIVENWAGKNDLGMMEIVGNIYENSNLIKG